MNFEYDCINQTRVPTASGAYTIYTGNIILNSVKKLLDGDKRLLSGKAMVVIDTEAYNMHLDKIESFLSNFDDKIYVKTIESSEDIKSWANAGDLLQWASEIELNRSSLFIAIGGGVVGDLVGFVASTYMRGSNLIHVPTTLLAQVDSSIGGKVAVNHAGYKNLVGTFYQPNTVISDTEFLKTLPKRELIAGLAEIFKYGILKNRELFYTVMEIFSKNEILSGANELWEQTYPWLISNSCEIKAQIVTQDEQDLGERMLLNLGHTFAHILEAITDYQYFKHGEAVAWGLAFAAELAYQKGVLSLDEYHDIVKIPSLMQIPPLPKKAKNSQAIKNLLHRDKKIDQAGIRVILPNGIGSADIYRCSSEEVVDIILKWQ